MYLRKYRRKAYPVHRRDCLQRLNCWVAGLEGKVYLDLAGRKVPEFRRLKFVDTRWAVSLPEDFVVLPPVFFLLIERLLDWRP